MRYSLLAAAWRMAAAVSVLNVAALAQSLPHPPAERADPLNAEAPVPPAAYRSALAGYRSLADEKVMPWKESNDTAGRIGGWRAYARQAREGEPAMPADTPPGPGAAPAAPGTVRPTPGHEMN